MQYRVLQHVHTLPSAATARSREALPRSAALITGREARARLQVLARQRTFQTKLAAVKDVDKQGVCRFFGESMAFNAAMWKAGVEERVW